MNYRALTGEDEELIAAAQEAMGRCYRRDFHHVASAVRAGSGRIYTGVHLQSPGVDVCAEWAALGSSAAAGERKLTCIVAVDRRGVMSPCGVCRELLHYQAPEIDVIVPDESGRPAKVTIAELLPIPYFRRVVKER